MLLRSDAALGGNDLRIGRQKLRADIDRDVQEPAGIVPEIEHQRLHPTLLQVIERLRQFFRGRFVELNQADVTDLERTAQVRVEYPGPLYALHFYLRPFEREILDLLRGGTQNRQRHFLPGRPAQEVDRILQLHSFGRVSVDPQNLIAGKNARLCRRRVFHRRDDREQPALYRHLNAEAVEPAAGVILHVLEVIRLHELAVRIERREHAFHRGINQIVVTRLVPVHVILPEQLDRFRENRNLRVAAIVVPAGGMGRVEPDSEEKVEKNKAREGAKQEAALHLGFVVRGNDDRSSGNFWQRANRPLRSRRRKSMKFRSMKLRRF